MGLGVESGSGFFWAERGEFQDDVFGLSLRRLNLRHKSDSASERRDSAAVSPNGRGLVIVEAS